MLYTLHEFNRIALSPLTYASSLVAETFSNPFSPYSYVPGSRRVAARFDLLNRISKEYKKPEWDIDEVEINGKAVSVTPETVVSKPFCNLVHFKRGASKNPDGDPTVLIVAPISGHHATLLRDTVKRMLTDFDVYITDWIDARNVPVNQGAFDLDENVYYVISFLHALNKRVHVMAVCQPSVPVFGAVALMSQQNDPLVPLSMTLMGGPIDTKQSPTVVNNLADEHSLAWFETQMIQRVPPRYPGGGRLVYPGFVQLMGFIAMNPRNHMKSYNEYYLDLMRGNEPEADKHRSFYDEYNAVCDLPAEFYLQTIKVVFQDNALANGTWKVGSHLIDPSAITSTALLTVEGELDDITGVGQTSAAHDLTPNLSADKKKIFIAEGSGHYGIFSGRRWRNKVFPVVADFINAAQEDEEKQLLSRLRAEVEAAIRKENEAKARADARKKAREDVKANEAKAELEAKAKAEKAEEQAKLEAERIAKANEQAKLEAERLAKANEQAKLEAERLAKANEQAKLETERLAKVKAEAAEKAEAENLAKQEASKEAVQSSIDELSKDTVTTISSTPTARKSPTRKVASKVAKQ